MTSRSGWLPLTSCQQKTVGADGGDAGDVPQRRGENQSLRLHLPSEAAQGDLVLLAKANHKDLKTLHSGGRAVALHDNNGSGGSMAAVQENPEADFMVAISGDRRRGGGAA